MQIITGIQSRPRRVLLYGTHGIGKSTWAAGAPAPIALQTEDGLADIGIHRTPLLKDLGSLHGAISWLMQNPHEYSTVILDTIDWAERLVFNQVALENNVPSIDKIDFGKGYGFAMKHWEFLLKSLDHLRDSRGMGVILLAHAGVEKVESPDGPIYKKFWPDIDKRACPMIQEWCDEVLFAKYEVYTVSEDAGFNRTRARAVGSGERWVYTCEHPTFYAKRRVNLPDKLPLQFSSYMAAVKAARQAGGDIAGIVNNGSSKAPAEPVAAA